MEGPSRSRYLTLRDYFRVLRRYAVPIVLIALVGAAAGLIDAKRQPRSYSATATVAFQDPAQNLSLLGLGTGSVVDPGTVAAEQQETLSRPDVVLAVEKRLRAAHVTAAPASSISSALSQVGFLQISAASSSSSFAARLANAYANVVVKQTNQQARASFATAAGAVQREIAAAQKANSRSPSTASQLTVLGNELAPLLSLSKVAQSAQLEQAAQPPLTPVSSHSARNALLGLAIGLLIAILLAFLRDSLDRRIRTTQDFETSYALPILGHVRQQVMGTVAQRPAKPRNDSELDVEAFRILRRNLEFLNLEAPPQTIVVTSALPGEGKTTVAASLACAMAAARKRTLLVECDLRRPVLDDRLGIERTPGLSEYLTGRASPEEILRTVRVNNYGGEASANRTASMNRDDAPQSRAPAGLDADSYSFVAIPAGTPTSRADELLGSQRFVDFLEQVRRVYDAVVIDSTPLLPLADTREIVPHVDAILLCAPAAKATRDEARATRTALERLPQRPTGVVVTGLKPTRGDPESYAYSYSYT